MKRPLNIASAAIVFACGLFAGACTHTSTASSTTTPTTPTNPPTVTESFVGTLPVGGSMFYSFNIGVSGTVNLTLNSVGGAFVPSTIQLGLGIGTPSGTDCSSTSTVTAGAGTSPQLTGTFGPGLFCARVYDVGNLFAPANFNVTIAHP